MSLVEGFPHNTNGATAPPESILVKNGLRIVQSSRRGLSVGAVICRPHPFITSKNWMTHVSDLNY